MARYEYRVIPAPSRGEKARGVKSPEGRFARSVESLLNRMAAEGWEFQRAELLPSEERSGLTGSATKWRNLLVFRRAAEAETEAFRPEILAAPDPVAQTAAPPVMAPSRLDEPATEEITPEPAAAPAAAEPAAAMVAHPSRPATARIEPMPPAAKDGPDPSRKVVTPEFVRWRAGEPSDKPDEDGGKG